MNEQVRQRRDTIVIGASSGGVSALRTLLAGLRSDLAASVLIVLHQADTASHLVEVLQPVSSLPVLRVNEPQELAPGQIYVAPPDQHLVLFEDRLLLTRGPLENRSRPAINPLFRTAAATRNSRVVAVLLTGQLDDGVAGLAAVKRCGGVTLVQDPKEAEYPDMPRHAMDAGVVDHVLSLMHMPHRLHALTHEEAAPVAVPSDLLIEAQLSITTQSDVSTMDRLGERCVVSCPECGGSLWRVGEGEAAVYRCYLGHALSTHALLNGLSAEVEQALWAAVRVLTERATMLRKMTDIDEHQNRRMAAVYRKRATEAVAQADQVRNFLLSLRMPQVQNDSPDDPVPNE